jgi:hypothetical protein
MSLLRTVRDADCGEGVRGEYYESHRYELAATKVRDFIIFPDTYQKSASGELVLRGAPKSSLGEWRA